MNSLKLWIAVVLMFFTQLAFCQLSNFTLTVTKVDETCSNNGRMNFSVSNTTPGATMLFSIFRLPDVTTPISVQSASSISGLDSGTYRVVATQSLGNDSGSQQRDITIDDLIRTLSYQMTSTNEICGNDGTMTVTVSEGTAFNYEIISGPMVRPLQASNVFTGLTAGVYQVRVFDICNQGVVQTHTLLRSDPRLNFTLSPPSLASCTTINIGATFQTVVAPPFGVIKYPLQITTTVTPPTGPVITYPPQSIGSGNGFSQEVPLYPNQTYSYSFVITDGCGISYTLNGTVENLFVGPPTYTIRPEDCDHKFVAFANVTGLTLASAPAGYLGLVPQNFTPLITENNTVSVGHLTAGTYVFNAIDLCGNPHTITIEIEIDNNGTAPFHSLFNVTCVDATLFIYEIEQLILVSCPPTFVVTLPHDYTSLINSAHYAAFANMPVGTYVFNVVDRCGNPRPMVITIAPNSQGPTAIVLEGCDEGVGSLEITGQLTSISLVSAPAAYNVALPANLTASVLNGTKLTLDTLPPGSYVFESLNSCNQAYTTSVTIVGYQDSTAATVFPNCGSFNFTLSHTSNNTAVSFWLQEWNPVNNTWGHPLTGAVYTEGSNPTTTNSIAITIPGINYNLAFTGHFRILKVYRGYSAGSLQPISCFKVVHEFDFSGEPRINDVYSISCGSTFEVVVNAEGSPPLTYRIIRRNGQPFLIDNGSSGIFTGLIPALYVFEVEDVCHNTVTSEFELLNPNPMVITASPVVCNGQSFTLSVPNFSFLTYQWWQGNNTSNIISTTNSLNFPSFNSATHNGVYNVRITFAGNPNSCLNQVLNYTVNITNTAPRAGSDSTVPYCGRQGTIDLTSLLSGSFDSGGVWSEITSSGTLSTNLWNTSNVPFGTYQFRYTVTGTCSQVDDALINIMIKEIPQIPTASSDPVICESQDLNLFATTVPNGTYHWNGPNGFVSSLQNPTLTAISAAQSGTYTVHSEYNSCQSGNSSVEIQVNPLPSLVLNQGCVEREYRVWATTDQESSSFTWTGPSAFTSSQSAITITGGDTGTYFATVTDQNGCKASDSIQVDRVNCFIPNVITPNNDESNESLDLTGFDVKKLEIFNRWGRKVYEKGNYINEWHGQNMSGGILPDSTYYYVIELGTEETKTGWIFLSRG
ncbi:T9SS type B sorting domain-containing protein [Flavobacterium sp.]